MLDIDMIAAGNNLYIVTLSGKTGFATRSHNVVSIKEDNDGTLVRSVRPRRPSKRIPLRRASVQLHAGRSDNLSSLKRFVATYMALLWARRYVHSFNTMLNRTSRYVLYIGRS
jgi:hypothetical protein